LGWALVRSKRNIQRGIEKLLNALECLPENTDLMIKLSGVLYSERPTESDLRHAIKLMKRVIDKWRKNAPAFFLKGKIHIKLKENANAIQAIERAVEICLKDPLQGPPTPNHYFFLGKAYTKDKEYKIGMQNFKKALAL
jgi:tetratricopeptide (TPR) repeat protein